MENTLQELSQLATLAGLLGGFAFTAIIQLLSIERQGKIITATIMVFYPLYPDVPAGSPDVYPDFFSSNGIGKVDRITGQPRYVRRSGHLWRCLPPGDRHWTGWLDPLESPRNCHNDPGCDCDLLNRQHHSLHSRSFCIDEPVRTTQNKHLKICFFSANLSSAGREFSIDAVKRPCSDSQ